MLFFYIFLSARLFSFNFSPLICANRLKRTHVPWRINSVNSACMTVIVLSES